MGSPKEKLYPNTEALALYRKAKDIGYPMENPDFFQHVYLWQLDEMVNYNRYDC